jgi:RNA polymerase sigma-70 factor (ECF subfamily)
VAGSIEQPEDADIYAELAPELIRFSSALVGPGDAADVLSSAFVRVLASPRWSSVSNRKAYLYRAVFNEAQSWNRRSRQRREREARAAERDWFEVSGFDPAVGEEVGKLSTRQRAVVVLTYWADLDPATIATRLGISEGSVRRHLARARKRLREVLDAES